MTRERTTAGLAARIRGLPIMLFRDRFKLPDTTVLILDCPLIMPELSDVELCAKIREALARCPPDLSSGM